MRSNGPPSDLAELIKLAEHIEGMIELMNKQIIERFDELADALREIRREDRDREAVRQRTETR